MSGWLGLVTAAATYPANRFLTASGTVMPNTFIAGAQKSATSTLHAWLEGHPQCVMSTPKEPMVFSRRGGYEASGYKGFFQPCSFGEDVRVVGEASTTYLSFPGVPDRIHRAVGAEPRFIFVLRNPAERAVSAYWHMVKLFHERRSLDDVFRFDPADTESAIEVERQEMTRAEENGQIVTDRYESTLGDRYWPFRYLRNSLYLKDLMRFEEIFGRRQMLVLLTDDVASRPVETFREMARFLSIDDRIVPASVGTRVNVASVTSGFWLPRLMDNIRKRSPAPMAYLIGRGLSVLRTSPPETSCQLATKLRQLFCEKNAQLATWLNRDLSMWSHPPRS